MDDEEIEENKAEAKRFLKWLGNRIRKLRRERKMSQEQLAEAAELVQHFISQIERGQRNVSVVTAKALARALEVTMSEMFEGAESET